VGPRLEIVSSWRLVGGFHGVPIGSRIFFLPPGCSFWLPGVDGVEVHDARDDSWKGSFAKRLYWEISFPTWGGQCGWARLPSALAYSL
jgi:hypothetical protein